MKKLFLSLGLLAGFAAGQKTVELDVIIRDFSVSHPDFEAWDALQSPRQCAERAEDGSAPNVDGAIKICEDFNPCDCGDMNGEVCTPSSVPDKPLYYGEWRANDGTLYRGFNTQYGQGGLGYAKVWAQYVYITSGMVQSKLDYSKVPSTAVTKQDSALYAVPLRKNRDRCHNDNFDDWFNDNKDVNKTINDVITLTAVENAKGVYEIEYNWNSDERGYFPLEKFEESETFSGRESLILWCRPTEQGSKDDNPGCDDYNDARGRVDHEFFDFNGKSTGAAKRAVDAVEAAWRKANWVLPEGGLLRNYHFTMAGSAAFKYKAGTSSSPNIFEFEGDDDMWIFIDGEMVADLGGTHIAAPAKINIDDVAKRRGGWDEGSIHTINFYYADRQTDGSNMKLRMALTGIIPSTFGAPRIQKAETSGFGEEAVTRIYLNNKINEDAFAQFVNNTSSYPILVKAANGDTVAYKVTSITFNSAQVDGQVYDLTGVVCLNRECSETRQLNTGDSLSFNFRTIPTELENEFYLDEDAEQILSLSGAAVVQPSWGGNVTTLPPIEFVPILNNETVVKPEFDVGTMFQPGEIANTPGPTNPGILDNIKTMINSEGDEVPFAKNESSTPINGFGAASNSVINPTKTGEMILTLYPSSNNAGWDEQSPYFGLPPRAGENGFGSIDPTQIGDGGVVSFLKNGFPGESNVDGSMRVSPTRCVTDENQNVNCLNLSIPAQQPFEINVTVFDHMGHFITQYRDGITEQEFRYVTQAANYNGNSSELPSEAQGPYWKCSEDEPYGSKHNLVKNGRVQVSVNIYPFSQTGRRIGSGVYIVKIDRIDKEFAGCFNAGGASDWSEYNYQRYHSEEKIGWMRNTSKAE